MDAGNLQIGAPLLRSLFDTLDPGSSGKGVGAFGGLPRLAEALGLPGEGPGTAGLGGLAGLLDAVSLSGESQDTAQSVLQVLSLQQTIAITQVTGVSVPLDNALDLGDALDAQSTADRIVGFATGLFETFAAQNPDLTPDEASAQFESVVRGAIDEGFSQTLDVLQGLGNLDGELERFVADIRAAVDVGLDAFFDSGAADAAPVAADGRVLPSAGTFGITSVQQVNVSVSLQVARARIETRAADALGDSAPETRPVDVLDTRGFDELTNELMNLADGLVTRLQSGEDLLGGGGLQGLLDQVLGIVGAGFDDALRIFDGFGAPQLADGSSVQGVFAASFQSVELNVSQTRIETSDGLVIEQASVSLRVVQVQIQAAVGVNLGGQGENDSPVPESPEDVARNVLDFASGLFGLFRAQNPGLDDAHALDQFIALTRDAAARGADEARGILEALGASDAEHESDIPGVLTALDALLADRFPQAFTLPA